MKHIEIALGTARHLGTAIPVDQLPEYIAKAQENNLELYRSIFSFDEGIYEHLKNNRSPSTYKGIRYIDQLVFDIDKRSDTNAMCHSRAKEFGRILMEDWGLSKELIHFYFSGRGYHIVTPDIFGFEPSADLAKTVKPTLDSAFSIPDTIFYHNAGLIRVENTINMKTGRYKTYLTYDEMYGDWEDILDLAKEPRNYEVPPFPPFDPKNINKHMIKESPKVTPKILDVSQVDKNAPCFQTMYNVGEEEGTRHIRIIRLASHYRKIGLPLVAAISALKAYAPSLEPTEVEKQVKSIYEKGYNWSCDDPELVKFCTSNCIYHKNKDYAPSIMTATDLERKYIDYLHTDHGHKAFNLAEIYNLRDENNELLKCTVAPETFILFFGDSGLGKTAIAQNIAIKLSKMRILYVSSEFGLNLLYRRFVQIKHNMTQQEVEAHYRNNDNTLSKGLEHITFFGKGMTTNELETIVKKHLPDLLILDVVDGIKAPGKEVGTVGNDIEVTLMIRHIIEKYKIIVLGVHHISKHASEDRDGKPKKLTMHSGKGSSFFEQKADIVLGVEGNPDESTRLISTMKGRDIAPFRVLQRFDKERFVFTNVYI